MDTLYIAGLMAFWGAVCFMAGAAYAWNKERK